MNGAIPQAVIAFRDATGLPLDVCQSSGFVAGAAFVSVLLLAWSMIR